MEKNYYDILKINKNATSAEIKSAFKSLASFYHPDKNSSIEAEDKFKEVNEAYQVLSDPDKRRKYDYSKKTINFDSFNNFKNYKTSQSTRTVEKLDINIQLKLPLEEIYLGLDKKIFYNRNIKCYTCNGTSNLHGKASCPECNGEGKFNGILCPFCDGKGERIINHKKCLECSNGKKQFRDNYIITDIWKIKESKTLNLISKGHEGQTGRNGELIINIEVENNTKFTFDESKNLLLCINLDFMELLHGCEHLIDHLDGKQFKLKIPPKTLPNSMFKLPSKGFLKSKTERGDLFIKVNLNLDSINEELFNNLIQ
jgi:molecular chaperone DnaJ